MTENAVLQILAAVTSLIGTIFSGVMAYFMVKLKTQSEMAAAATRQVAATLSENVSTTEGKLSNLATVTAATHMLVNSASLVQLRLNALMAKRIAELTRDEGDIQAATLANDLYERHKVQQLALDKYPEIKKAMNAVTVAQQNKPLSDSLNKCTMRDCKFRVGSPECQVTDCPFRTGPVSPASSPPATGTIHSDGTNVTKREPELAEQKQSEA